MIGFWKVWGKKNRQKKWKKRKAKENKKIDSKLINYYYIFLWIYFTYFPPWYKDYIILKCINF